MSFSGDFFNTERRKAKSAERLQQKAKDLKDKEARLEVVRMAQAARGTLASLQSVIDSGRYTAAEITAVSEIAQWRFTPGAITQQLMDDYTAEVQPKGKAAAA